MDRRSSLKAKRSKFIREYLIDFDGTAAAIRAGYSEHTACVMASKLMANPEVKKEFEKKYAEYKKKYEIRREFIVDKLLELIKDEKTAKDKKNYIKALDMLSKMSGQYVHTIINKTEDQPLFPE